MERKAFPRGGATDEDENKNRNQKNSHWLPATKKKKSKKARNDSESDPDADYELEERLEKEGETKVTIFDLDYKNIHPKMKLIGRVAEIHDNCVEVHLPGAVLGTVPTHNIIDMINGSKNTADKYANVPPLSDLLKVDQLVVAEVSNVVREAKSKHGKGTSVYLSLNPQDIYKGLSHMVVAQVGFILQAFVRSVEDHGYILDCGIQDLHVFLNNKDCEKYCSRWNNGNPLVKGQIVRGVVIKASSAKVQSQVELSIDPYKVAKAEKTPPNDVEDASHLVPGMRFVLEVTKRLSNGLAVNFDEFEGFIVERNIPQSLKDSYVGDSFLGCLLYISKPLNVPMFSAVPSVVDSTVSPAREFKYGDIIKSAVVVSESYRGICLLLNKKSGTRGYVPPGYKKNAEKESNSKDMHQVGKTVRCRVLNYDSLSESYMCTTLESALKERLFTPSDVPVGSIVTATVTGFTNKSLIVSVGAVVGYIPWFHTADSPIQTFAEKFNVGQKIKGRVLRHIGGKIDVTAKDSLVKKDCVVLKSYDQAVPGQVYPGTVVAVKGEGYVVNFFDGVKGILPYSKTDSAFKKVGSSNVGRLVKCRVDSCKGDKLVLSLSDSVSMDKVIAGLNYSPVVAEIDKKNRILQVMSGASIRGNIPVYHLHDSQKLADEIFHTYSIGDVVENARCFTSGADVVFSTRGSVRRFFESEVGKAVSKEGSSALKVGTVLPCFVRTLGSDVTLSTPLADSRFIYRIKKDQILTKDTRIGDYIPLLVKDVQKKIFEQVSDVPGDKVADAVDFLENILEGNRKLETYAKKCTSPLSSFKAGQKVNGPVESFESGFKVCMANGVRGHVNKFCTDENPVVGEIVKGKVIYVDYERSELILSLQKTVLTKLNVGKHPTEIEDGATVSGKIVRGFTDFYLALVDVNDTLRRAFIPKYAYPSRHATLVTKGAMGEEMEFTVIRKYGNDLLCLPTNKLKDLKPKEKLAAGTSEGEEKKKRRRKRNNSSSSVDLEEGKLEKNGSVGKNSAEKRSRKRRNKHKKMSPDTVNGENQTDSVKVSPKKLKKTEETAADIRETKPSEETCVSDEGLKKQGIINKLGISKKQAKSKTIKAKSLSMKMKNEKVLSAIVESVTGSSAKSPLVQSSDKTKKSLKMAKIGKNKNVLKSVRKPAKRLKKSITVKTFSKS